MAGRTLDPAEIVATAIRLRARIIERFPTANLGAFGAELVQVAQKAERRTAWIRKPLIWMRVSAGLVIAVGFALFVFALRGADVSIAPIALGELAQDLEAALSGTAIVGAAIFFLLTAETRVKRARALRAIRELRVMAHLVDMHQLVKDPQNPRMTGVDTASSPPRKMTPYELSRYLDYCSEMLALLSKVAQLYVNDLDDPTVMASVDALEQLVSGLSEKIWHKMTMIDRYVTEPPHAGGAGASIATGPPASG